MGKLILLACKLQTDLAARLLRFSTAVNVNLIAVCLQRAYRKATAIALFKAKIDRLVFLQVGLHINSFIQFL